MLKRPCDARLTAPGSASAAIAATAISSVARAKIPFLIRYTPCGYSGMRSCMVRAVRSSRPEDGRDDRRPAAGKGGPDGFLCFERDTGYWAFGQRFQYLL